MGLKLRACGLAIALVAVLAPGVAASAPLRDRWSDTFEDIAFEACDGFDLLGTGSISVNEALFTDQDGNERLRYVVSVSVTWTRSDTGEFLGTEFGTSVLLAPLDGTLRSTWVGLRAKDTYTNGEGFMEVGYIDFDADGNPILVAGPHPYGTGEAVRCDYLT